MLRLNALRSFCLFVIFAVFAVPAISQSPSTSTAPSSTVVGKAPQEAVPRAQAPETEPATEPDSKSDSEPETRIFDEISVEGRATDLRGIADSANQGVTGRADLARRPILRAGEILETVPGLIVTQHSGSGKANQYFLRGFNLDHGTDFRVTVDGVPVNLPSHGHGQGYSDLNFLIPELVSTIEFRKGTYSAEDGDFASAGAAHLQLVDELPQGLISATAGELGYDRLVAADSWRLGADRLLVGVERQQSDGPWDRPDDFGKTNAVIRWSAGDAARGFSLTASAYDASWNSTDQIPERAVSSGLIGRFGGLDGSDGGASSRYALSYAARRGTDSTIDRINAYAVAYDLNLFSNFTFFLDDPVHGDQFEQRDDRQFVGFKVDRQWISSVGAFSNGAARPLEVRAGFEARADWIDNGLYSTVGRVRLGTTREDQIRQLSAAPFAEASLRVRPWLRVLGGLRADAYQARVESDRPENSGTRSAILMSPKLSFELGPWRGAEIYLNYGFGFHSNDARGATIRVDPKSGEAVARVQPLVRSEGLDLGLRFEPIPHWRSTLSLFALDLDSELVFVGDAGGTEAGRPSRRTGFEWANFWQPHPKLAFDADVTLSRGRFRDQDAVGDHIPGAIEQSVAAGISVGPLGKWSGSVRLRHFGARDLTEDGSVRSPATNLINARLAFSLGGGLDLAAEGFNVFDAQASDIDYFYASRLPGESSEGVEDRHFHPSEPRSIRLRLEWRF